MGWISPFDSTITMMPATARVRNGYATYSISFKSLYKVELQLTGDMWISTADMENYPTIYRYNNNLSDIADQSQRWELVDKTRSNHRRWCAVC
jgi:hypothetical protein